ncbi:hypothetical protein [Amycolatopsis cihanbeyliensis]|uniref:Dolichyl-phosphate-mannose-protein mannosyltransferase n=1 Tax=Amycolatopsis cihanbeyliensis TaxID=1128664 RepID=A0A542DBV5_AMYCI|nr:hypothetical protein [Amycolatopsis cihanbeyliensis]TQJ00558.1 hypothetical protein FB471_0189 [Amycolatopsis cihanbeyliensis]
MSALGNPVASQTGDLEQPQPSGRALSPAAATVTTSGAAPADVVDDWAKTGDSARLTELFALTPGNPATAYVVDDGGADAPSVFGQPIPAWNAFRGGAPGTRLLAVGDRLNREIAVARPGGGVEFVPVDQESVTGTATPDALRTWRKHLVSLPASDAAEHDPATADDLERMPECSVDTPGGAQGRGLWGLGYVVLGLVALALGFLFFRVTMDDSFITWRYGKNLVEHGVWNWNSDGPPVEGYTNPLYAVLSIIPAALGISAELFFKILAVGIAVGYVVVVRRARLPRGQEFVLFAVTLASPIFHLQLFMGLETVSFALLIAWLFAIVYRRGALGRGGFVLAGAVALSRPEGIVLAAVAICWSLLIDRSTANRRGAFVVLAGWAVYWGARWWYFGSFFPNTFYKKTSGDEPLLIKIMYVLPVAGPILLPVLIGLVLGFALYRRVTGASLWSRTEMLRDAVPVVLAVTSAVLVFGVYRQSELVMDTGHRFYWQLLFPVALLVLSRPMRLVSDPGTPEPGRQRGLALVALAVATGTVLLWAPGQLSTGVAIGTGIVAIAVVAGSMRKIAGAAALGAVGLSTVVGFGDATEMTSMLAYRYRLAAAHQAVGQAIHQAQLPDGALAVADAGVLPYQADRRAIDIGGLATRESVDGTLESEFLDDQNLQLAILLSSSDNAESTWRTHAAQSVHSYVTEPSRDFWAAPAAEFAPNYYLNYWIGPEWRGGDLSQRLNEVFQHSWAQNERSDTDIVMDNLWNFSFLGR